MTVVGMHPKRETVTSDQSSAPPKRSSAIESKSAARTSTLDCPKRPLAPIEVSYWEPPRPAPPIEARTRRPLVGRIWTAVLVGATHLGWFWWIVAAPYEMPAIEPAPFASMAVDIINSPPTVTDFPQPEPPAFDVPVQLPPILVPDVIVAGQPGPSGRTAFQAPRLDPSAHTDVAPYARMAGLAPGRRAIVILAVDVGADGTPTSVAIDRSSNDSAADSAAAEYARSLRWIPGVLRGERVPMRIRFTVALAFS